MQVLLADHHVLVRQGTRALLERHGFEVIGEAGDGVQAVAMVRQCRPDIAVLETLLPGMSGLDAARQIHRASPTTRAILLTSLARDTDVLAGFRDGVRGFVLKTQPIEDLLHAIHEVARGGIYVGPDASVAILIGLRAAGMLAREPLSTRERQVLQLVAEGKTTKQVAAFLSIKVKTAEYYRTRLMKKINVHDTPALVRYAIRHGLTEP